MTERFLEDAQRVGLVTSSKSCDSFRAAAKGLQKAYPSKRIAEITEVHVLDYFAAHPKWSPNTRRTYRNRLNTIFEWATTDAAGCAVLRSPMTRLRLETKRTWTPKNVRQGNWLRREKVREVIDGYSLDDVMELRTRLILVLGFYLGLRVSELAGMSWGHVNWDAFELEVWRIDGSNRRTRTLRPGGKGEKPATLGIADEVYETLKRWRVETEAGLGRAVAPSDPIMCTVVALPVAHRRTHRGRVESGSNIAVPDWGVRSAEPGIRNAVQRAGVKAGLQRVLNPHDMRRSFAQMLRDARDESTGERRYDLEDIRKMLRHSSIATTQGYLEQSNADTVDKGRRFTI